MVHQIVNLSSFIPSMSQDTSTQTDGTQKQEYAGPKWWLCLVTYWPTISQPIGLLCIYFLLWAIGRTLFPDYTYPNSVLMRMSFLFVGAQLCGILITFIRLPEMLGMLCFGILFTNLGFGNFSEYSGLETVLRELALVNIMLLAGLGIDIQALVKLFSTVLRLTLIPTIAEVSVVAILSVVALKLPWLWGLLLGLVITAVSPNVVVDILLRLREEKLGLYKGIHTIIIAVTTCNDVISIFFFGVVLGIIFSTGPLTEQLLQGPIGIAIGVVYGFLSGILICIMPSNRSNYANGIRFLMMVLGGMFSVLGSKAIGYPSAGALGCIIIACVTGTTWKKQHRGENDVIVKLNLLWKFVKPISFALIGKEVDFAKLDIKVVGLGIAIVIAGSCLRLLCSYALAYGADLNWKEKAYVTISGFPKATVQAALGPVALDLTRKLKSEESYEFANIVLIVSVIAIVLTAPIGAVIMVKMAPVWLKGPQSLHQPANPMPN